MTTPYVISLTSYPPRFNSLLLVLESILSWDVLPERIYLNIANEDIEKLPNGILNAEYSHLLMIKEVVDIGPCTKLIPTLINEKILPIITIDDDVIYPRDLVAKILADHLIFPTSIIAGRTHFITQDQSSNVKSYMDWEFEQSRENGPSAKLFPTGVGMILYPQGSFHEDVSDLDLLSSTGAIYTDDIWHFFQARRNGTLVRQISERYNLNYVEGSQEVGLWINGNQVRNDVVFAELVGLYGNPCNL
jgi:hypothetical protein